METLEQRKAKYRQHMDKAEEYEEEGDLSNAFKEYRKALPYCLHKADSDHIKKKIQAMQDMHQYLNRMPEEGGKGLPKPLLFGGAAVLVLLIAAGAAAFFLF